MGRPKNKHKRSRQHFIQADKITGLVPSRTVFPFVVIENDQVTPTWTNRSIYVMFDSELDFAIRRELSNQSQELNIYTASFAEYSSVLATLNACYVHNESFFANVIHSWDTYKNGRHGLSLIEYIERAFRWFADLEIDIDNAQYSRQWDLLKVKYTWTELGLSDWVYLNLRTPHVFKNFVYDYKPEEIGVTDFEDCVVEWDPWVLRVYSSQESPEILTSVTRDHKIWNLKPKVKQ